MRWLVACAAVATIACGSEERGEPPVDEPAPEPIEARHGGAIVELDEHVAELVVHASGELHVHVRSDADLSDAGVTVTLDDDRGEEHSVALRWADEVQGFVGHLDATPATGDAEVILVREGHRSRGRTQIARVLPEAEHEGSVMSVGEHVVEVVVEPDGRAHLYLLDAPRQRLDVELTLSVAGEEGRLHPLGLAWDAEEERYSGRLEGMTPRPGPMEVILERGGREHLGRGTLLDVGLEAPASVLEGGGVPEDLRLEMPELGSDLPAVIAVPPAEAEEATGEDTADEG